jgi:hypothetical protein
LLLLVVVVAYQEDNTFVVASLISFPISRLRTVSDDCCQQGVPVPNEVRSLFTHRQMDSFMKNFAFTNHV